MKLPTRGTAWAVALFAALDCQRNLLLRVSFLDVERSGLGLWTNRLYLVSCLATVVGLALSIGLTRWDVAGRVPAWLAKLAPGMAGLVAALIMAGALVTTGPLAATLLGLATVSAACGLGLALVRASRLVSPRLAALLVGAGLASAGPVTVALAQADALAGLAVIAALAGLALLAAYLTPVTAVRRRELAAGAKFHRRVERDLGSRRLLNLVLALLVIAAVAHDIGDNIIYANPAFASPIAPYLVLGVGVAAFVGAGYLADRFGFMVLAVVAFAALAISQSLGFFTDNQALALPYLVLTAIGAYCLQLLVKAAPFRFATKFRQLDALPQLGWMIFATCCLVVSGVYEIVGVDDPPTFSAWLLLLIALAGAGLATVCWVGELRQRLEAAPGRVPSSPSTPALETANPLAQGVEQAVWLHELTGRQQEVLTLLGQGQTNDQIAQALVITTATAKFHVKNVLAKLELSRREVPAYLASLAEESPR